MADMLALFKIMLVMSAFYGVGITLFSHVLPADALNYVTANELISGQEDSITAVSNQAEAALTNQRNVPFIELGALVFYSGNILIDFLVNSLTAVPQMFGLIINGMMAIINADGFLFAQIELFIVAIFSVLYVVGLIQVLLSVRSGNTVV